MRWLTCLTLLAAACAPAPPETSSRGPNIVLIMADDQGWGDLSLNGNANLSTPHIDSLARDGAQFERFYVSPVCSPTRAELLTGRYHPRGGVYGTSAGAERLDLDERTFAEALQEAGYATAVFGKWHNGSQHPYHPNARGFDEYYGVPSGHWANYFSPLLDHNGEIVRGEGFLIDDFTNRALAFIEANRDRPFLCYLPYNTPHSPMQVPDRFWDKFADAEPAMRNRDPERENVPHTRAALAMVENIDWNVGRILTRLDELGLTDDTLVIYLSDNGPNGWRWNGGMKGRKGSLDEGGLRSPALFRWPGEIPAGLEIDRIAAAIDLAPTLTELAGAKMPGDKPLDGVSLAPLLRGEGDDWPDRTLLSFRRGSEVSARDQRYRLDSEGRLFDIVADPGQLEDIAGDQPDVAARLAAIAREQGGAVLAELGEDDRPFPIGHAELTWLPARDAVASGGIERSNRFPNSSFFTGWTSTSGKIAWDVEALAGDYEVVVYYAGTAASVGTKLRLALGDRRRGGRGGARERRAAAWRRARPDAAPGIVLQGLPAARARRDPARGHARRAGPEGVGDSRRRGDRIRLLDLAARALGSPLRWLWRSLFRAATRRASPVGKVNNSRREHTIRPGAYTPDPDARRRGLRRCETQ